MDKLWSLLRSRRFWISAAGVLAMMFAPLFGVDEDVVKEQFDVLVEAGIRVVGAVAIIIGWVHGDSVRKTV